MKLFYKKIILLALVSLLTYSCQGPKFIEINFIETDISSLIDIERYTDLALQGESFDIDAIAIFIENYFMESQSNFNKKMIAYEELALLLEAEKMTNLPPLPTMNHSELIKHLKRLTGKFKNNPAIAPIVYTIAYSYFEEGNIDMGVEVFETFLAQYKTSHLRDEVAFRLGEIYFDTGRTVPALESYNKISKQDNSPFFIRGEFKKAWVHYRLNDFDEAINFFKIVIDSGLKRTTDRSHLDLSEGSKKTVVKIMAHLKPTEQKNYDKQLRSVMAKFRKSSYAPDLLLDLGDLLEVQGRSGEMIIPYKIFTDNYKNHKKIPFAYKGLAKSYLLEGQIEKSIETLTTLIESYNPGTKWYKNNFKKGDIETDKVISQSMVFVGDYHRDLSLALKTSDTEKYLVTINKAINNYKDHIKYFKDHQLAETTSISLADALFKIKSYNESAQYYTMAMELNRSTGNGDKAGLSALLTYELLITEEIEKSTDKTISKEKSTELANKIYYVENYFRNGFIGSPIEGKFYTLTSDMYFILNEFEKSLESLNSLLYAKGGSSDIYEKMGDAHSNLKHTNKAIESFELALQFRTPNSSKINKKLSSLYYVLAQDFKVANNNREAVDYYYKAFNTDKSSALGENSLLNIGQIHIAEKNIAEASTAVELMGQYFKKSPQYPTLLISVAKLLKEKSKFLDASKMLENAAISTKNNKDKQTYLFESFALLDFAGHSPTLIRKLKSYMASNTISKTRKAQAYYMLGVALIKSRDERRGLESLRNAISEQPTAENDYFRTKAKLQIAAVKTGKFTKLKLTLPFDKSFAKKEKLMREILADYRYALETKIADLLPETFYLMGVVLENLSLSLIESERPKGISEEEAEEYSFQLEEKAYPIDEEAIKAYSNSIKSSTEHELSTKFMGLSIQRLATLRPASFNRPIETPSQIYITSMEVKPLPLNAYLETQTTKKKLPPATKAIKIYNKGIKIFNSKPKKAISYFKDAIKVMPDFPEAYLMKGRGYLKINNKEKAFNAFLTATTLTRQLGEAYNNLALLQIDIGETDKAITALEESITLTEGNIALINLANINEVKENHNEALKYYRMAERIDPDNDYLKYNFGLYLYKQGEIKKSAVYIENSLNIIEQKPKEAVNISTALLLSGRVDKALKTLIEIKKLDPKNAQVYKALGVIYEIYKKDYKTSIVNYNKYLTLSYGTSESETRTKDTVNSWIKIAKQKDRK